MSSLPLAFPEKLLPPLIYKMHLTVKAGEYLDPLTLVVKQIPRGRIPAAHINVDIAPEAELPLLTRSGKKFPYIYSRASYREKSHRSEDRKATPDIIRDHVRLTLQPVDAPKTDPRMLVRTLEHIGSDRVLLFSTDYPHWHFDGEDVLPEGLPDQTIRRMLVDNPLETYPRLRDGAEAGDKATDEKEAVR